MRYGCCIASKVGSVIMGWWQIYSYDQPGIMLPNKDPEPMYNGDGPADIMGAALDDLVKEYQEAWGRKPYREEVLAALNFTLRDDMVSEKKIKRTFYRVEFQFVNDPPPKPPLHIQIYVEMPPGEWRDSDVMEHIIEN